ncbi:MULTISPECIES: hypothetical protein [Flavobacterium]|uniref:hypothetical protein n=1 Tax=Flavobacterium TaxID=237 RepID=UPI001FCC15A1|nr:MULTISPECIES: hypothetical protein [Flavobacterium]UOK41592.1 hypothetical protein LZF87_09745 [Flavobacterium enshiense]
MVEKFNEPQQTVAEIIAEYKKSLFSTYFNRVINSKDNDGDKNPHYYNDIINSFRNKNDDRLISNNNFKDCLELLKFYNAILSTLMVDLVQLFIAINKYDGTDETIINDINLSKIDVLNGLKTITEFKQNILYNIGDGNPILAIKIKNYCIPLFNEIKIIFRDKFFIDIENSPLKIDFDEVLNTLENSINIDEINLLQQLNKNDSEQPPQPETSKSVEVVKNNYPKIFKDDLSFTLFNKMFDYYKTETTHLAHFSFLFYAMQKDGFIICTNSEFIDFLENEPYNVVIEKIDSRQAGQNKKTTLYNSIKKRLTAEHTKSTI